MSNQGDPRLVLGADGSRLVFRDGQPVLDRGLENLALISLFTKKGWCGNLFMVEQIGSDFEKTCDQPITRNAIIEIGRAAELALANPVFGTVRAVVQNPTGHRLIVTITLGTGGVLVLTRDAGFWYYQTIDPASARL